MTKYGWKYFTLNGSLRALGKVYYAADISGSFSSSQFHISMDLLRLMLPVQFRTNLIYARLNQNLSFMPSLLALVRVLSILFLPVLVHD
jgi:phage-related holin